jgi:hypothetical protein
LRKNFISNEGIKSLSKYILLNSHLVHLELGCNQITSEGAVHLFSILEKHPSIVSLSLANTDCYKNKNK